MDGSVDERETGDLQAAGLYRRRVVDDELDALMSGVAAIELRGARGVGKTATARMRAASVFELDRPAVREVVRASPDVLTAGPFPVLVDEWQRMPESWDVVRRAVDADRTPGRFLLTGSASPRNPPTHTGALRIISLRMRPMTMPERGFEQPTVSLTSLLTGQRDAVSGTTAMRAPDYAREILRSGFPGLQGASERVVRAELDGYIDHVVTNDFDDSGVPIRNRAALRRWLSAYAAAASSTTSYEKIRDAATSGHAEKPAKTTVLRYIDVLESLWLVEPVPAWIPGTNELSRLTHGPRHQLVDPALVARLRGTTFDDLVRGQEAGPLAPAHTSLFGALFESLVTLSVRVFAQAAEASVAHFRSFGGEREVDLIVGGPGGRVVALEAKLAEAPDDHDVRHLVWIRDQLPERVADTAIVTTGSRAYRRPDGVAVVPLALLGP
jgi:uncharacterized protein